MDPGIMAGLLVIGSVFGMIGGIAAFLNAYKGYSHFPAIPKKRRMIMSLEIAGLAFIMTIGAVVITVFFIERTFM